MIKSILNKLRGIDDSRTDADRTLDYKKQLIYLLLVVSVSMTVALVVVFGNHILSLRASEGEIFIFLAKQRSQAQMLLNLNYDLLHHEKTSDPMELLERSENWVQSQNLFDQLVHGELEDDVIFFRIDSLIHMNEAVAYRIDSLINESVRHEIRLSNIQEMTQYFDQFSAGLNELSSTILNVSDRRLSVFIRNVTILLVISLSVFVYLFIFQIRPLFNQLFHKNKELRNISSNQSHIIRAPLANILGLIYLIENAESLDESMEYVRLIKLNAEAIDHRIHKLVHYAEQLQDFDGNPDNLMERIVLDESEVSAFNT